MVKGRKCSLCYFSDVCDSNHVCGGYSPITDDLSDEEVIDMVESGRREFYKRWNKYAYEYSDFF